MHALLDISKQFFLRNHLNKQIIKTNKLFLCELNRKQNTQSTQTTSQENKEKPSENTSNLNNTQQILNQTTDNNTNNLTNNINNNNNNNNNKKPEIFEIPKDPKTRKEEVMFYIMHDKYSVRPDKEYRISHTTLESTDNKTKMKDLNVLYYGNYKIL
jgi:hypothetical protein